jgi:hypothetical protein
MPELRIGPERYREVSSLAFRSTFPDRGIEDEVGENHSMESTTSCSGMVAP